MGFNDRIEWVKYNLMVYRHKFVITKKTLRSLRFWVVVYRSIGIAFLALFIYYRNLSYIYYSVMIFFISFVIYLENNYRSGRHKPWLKKKRMEEWKKKTEAVKDMENTSLSESKERQETQGPSGSEEKA